MREINQMIQVAKAERFHHCRLVFFIIMILSLVFMQNWKAALYTALTSAFVVWIIESVLLHDALNIQRLRKR